MVWGGMNPAYLPLPSVLLVSEYLSPTTYQIRSIHGVEDTGGLFVTLMMFNRYWRALTLALHHRNVLQCGTTAE